MVNSDGGGKYHPIAGTSGDAEPAATCLQKGHNGNGTVTEW